MDQAPDITAEERRKRREMAGLGQVGEGHRLACPRYPVAKLMDLLPEKYITELERNQKIASCCRHPENHLIEAWYSSPTETVPDIYKNICSCGRVHVRFCVGNGDVRPFWSVR